MGQFEGKIATNWPSEREKIKKGLKIDIEWLCPHAFNCPYWSPYISYSTSEEKLFL